MGKFEENQIYSYLGDKNPLGLPAVEQNSAFIATFKGIADSTPEVINNSAYFITYIVDEDGNLNKVADNSDAQRNFKQNFNIGQEVVVRIDQGTLLNPQLDGEHKITGLGSFVPILMTQTGSDVNDGLEKIEFLNFNQQVDDNVDSFLGVAFASGGFSTATTFIGGGEYAGELGPSLGSTGTSNNFYSPNTWITASGGDSTAVTWSLNTIVTETNGSGGNYVFTNPQPSLRFSSLQAKISFDTLNFNTQAGSIFVSLFRNRGGTVTLLSTQQFYYLDPAQVSNGIITPTEQQNTFITSIDPNQVKAGDALFMRVGEEAAAKAEIINNSDFSVFPTTGFAGNIILKKTTKSYPNGSTVVVPNFTFEFINQNPTKADLTIYDTNQTPYFETGSDSLNILTSSLYLTVNYGNVQLTPTASEDIGFSPVNSEFLLRKGDKIRFGFNSDNNYTIYNVKEPLSAGDPIYLTLDRELPEDLNINNFILFRNLDDGKFITLDVKRNNPQAGEVEFTGLIIPKHATQKLKDNVEDIILKLKEDDIIED